LRDPCVAITEGFFWLLFIKTHKDGEFQGTWKRKFVSVKKRTNFLFHVPWVSSRSWILDKNSGWQVRISWFRDFIIFLKPLWIRIFVIQNWIYYWVTISQVLQLLKWKEWNTFLSVKNWIFFSWSYIFSFAFHKEAFCFRTGRIEYSDFFQIEFSMQTLL